MRIDKDGPREVVAIRLGRSERVALDQLAGMTGESRSCALRRAITERMRRMMREHPAWPLHPAWIDAGDDGWVLSHFRRWAHALAAADPGAYLKKVTLDGLTGFRWREGGAPLEPGDSSGLSVWERRRAIEKQRRPRRSRQGRRGKDGVCRVSTKPGIPLNRRRHSHAH